MMYSYAKLPDETQIAYSVIQKDNAIFVAIKRPVDGGFDAARCLLPSYQWLGVEGFTSQEVQELTEFLKNNAPLILRLAREATKASES